LIKAKESHITLHFLYAECAQRWLPQLRCHAITFSATRDPGHCIERKIHQTPRELFQGERPFLMGM